MKLKSLFDWKYAIREIILIVVGISIAFTLDNWNTNRKLRNTELEILKEMNETLKADVNDINGNLRLYVKCNNGIRAILNAFDNNLPMHDSLITHFSTLTVNPMFFKNDGPYEVLKSKGFEIISSESLRLNIIDLYSVRYRVLDEMETSHPQYQGYEILFDYIKLYFKKSDKPNIEDYFSISIEPIDYEMLKNDLQFRLLINEVLFWNSTKINFYENTKNVILELQKDIEKEINI